MDINNKLEKSPHEFITLNVYILQMRSIRVIIHILLWFILISKKMTR